MHSGRVARAWEDVRPMDELACRKLVAEFAALIDSLCPPSIQARAVLTVRRVTNDYTTRALAALERALARMDSTEE